MPKYTITTAIAYPNGNPHLGHALEFVQADFLARYHRSLGEQVYFQTGLDEHGLKMQKAAAAAGKDTREFIEHQKEIFTEFASGLNISYDHFIRTSDERHKAMAQALWRACSKDIYKKTYRAWYNIKQEEFLGSADEHPDPSIYGIDPEFIELIEEENYFFATSRYTDEVLRLLKTGELKVYPENRSKELIRFVEDKGLQDISISREASRLSWGIEVPDDSSQVMYVWFDALTNYLTGCASLEDGKIVTDDQWPVNLHVVGKDISRFHGLLWPAMLLSAGLQTPRAILAHGFVLKDGKVMSKSLGNVIEPSEPLAKYGADPLRWFLLSALPTAEDGDFSMERLAEVYSSDLSNDYGNLVSRVLTMCHKYTEGRVPLVSEERVHNLEKVVTEENWADYDNALQNLEIQKALGEAKQLIVFCNRRIDEMKPWEMAKDEYKKGDLEELLYELLEIIRHATLMIRPAMPTITDRVWNELFRDTPDSREWALLKPGNALGPAPLILFPRHD